MFFEVLLDELTPGTISMNVLRPRPCMLIIANSQQIQKSSEARLESFDQYPNES